MPFGDSIRRVVWGKDFLVPVIGGALRYVVRHDGTIPMDTPAIVYPEGSYFGDVLQASDRPFSTRSLSQNPFCETALSSGIKQLALAGLGVGWLPYSMAHREIESGEIISLANNLGKVQLETALYADQNHEVARSVIDVWGAKRG
jgi:LysR family transcriptional regulator, hypochlorite-specific transcription factor HypT